MSLDRDTLLPCPFCGGDKVRFLQTREGEYMVICPTIGGCTISTGHSPSKEVVRDAWNRRALSQQAGDGWIPVSAESLPEIGREVWYYFEVTGVNYGKLLSGTCQADAVFGGRKGFLTGDVTHWMYAPTPPNTAAGRTCNLCNGTGYVQEADRDEPEPCGNCIDGIPDESDPDADTGERCQPAVPIAAPLTLPDVTYVIHADQPGYAGKQPFVPITDWRRMCAVAQQAIERMERAERESWQRLEDHNSQQRVAIKMQERAEAAEAQVAALTPALDDFRDTILNQRGALAENGMSNDQVNDVLSEFDDILATARGGKEK